jgi:transcriptional regulator
MYAFAPFVRTDPITAKQLVDNITMGTLVSMASPDAEASPLPFRFHSDEKTGEHRLEGHMDKRNPLWKHLEQNDKALMIFWGPNCYISPTRYETSPRVPTWLYQTLHIHGQAKVNHDGEWLSAHLNDLASHLEPPQSGWNLPDVASYKNRLISEIVGVTINISKMTAQLKLAQHNSAPDRKKLYRLLREGSKQEQLIADQMEQFDMAPDMDNAKG